MIPESDEEMYVCYRTEKDNRHNIIYTHNNSLFMTLLWTISDFCVKYYIGRLLFFFGETVICA